MRVLTDEEMDAIFGGDDSYAQTLDTVTVTATRIRDSGGYYLPGTNGFVKEETFAGCTTCASYYAYLYRAVPSNQIPSPARAKCLANATAQPGKVFRTGYELNIVPSRVFRNSSLPTGTSDWIHRGGQNVTSSGVAGYDQEVGAITIPRSDGTGATYLYASAMQYGYSHDKYINLAGQWVTGASQFLSVKEMLVYDIGHELYHQWNAFTPQNSDEDSANGWAIAAVNKFRAGAGANCPAQ